MSTEDKRIDDLYRYHNQPETGGLSSSELATVEAGRTAMQSLRKTFDLWIAVGRAVHTLRVKADRLQGRQTFKRLMAQQGFKMDGPQSERQLDKATVTRLIQIMDNLTAVTAWHEGLTDKQKIDWAGPSAIFKHCPVFAKPKNTPTKLTEKEQLKQSVAQLEEENHRLKKQRDDDGPEFDDEEEEGRDFETDIEPEHLRNAFLIRAHQAAEFAVYRGPVDSDVCVIADRVAQKWRSLAQALLGRLADRRGPKAARPPVSGAR